MGLLGFGRKKPALTAVAPPDRYAGKPFLKLVDAFVLKHIGALDPTQEALLVQMTPKFQETFGCPGSPWEEIVVKQLGFPAGIGGTILALWTKNQAIAKLGGRELAPMQFVEMFVAANVEGA